MMQKFLVQMKQSNTLSKIKRPVLVIHGDKDPIVLLRHGQAVADAIPNARFVIIPNMGHVFFNHALEKRIAQLVVDHLKRP
jgi:pimeloyl-ACP methyl ester carboxylesterase